MKSKSFENIFAFFIFFTCISIQAQTIFQAARSGNLERVKAIVDSSRQMINFKDSRGRSPLFFAVYGRQLPVVKYLVENGVDINEVTNKHNGPVTNLALNLGDKEIIDYLISNGGKAIPVQFKTEKLALNLTHLYFTTGMLNNILILDGSNGLIIFDSGYNKMAAETLKKHLDENYKNGVNYIINSHTDGDHVAGNKIYPNNNLVNVTRSILEGNPGIINAVKSSSPLTGRTGKSFETYYTAKLNGEDFKFIPYPGVHGNEDLVIHFTKSKVVFVGDLLLSQCYPAVSNPAAYLTFLEKLIDVLPLDAVYVSGHGKNIDHNGVIDYYNMLKKTIEIVRKHFDQGKDLNKIMSENILKDYEKDYSFLTFLAPDSWVNNVFNALKNKSL